MRQSSILAELSLLRNVIMQRNLNNAVRLAVEAAQGRGELVEHFADLGRLYGTSTDASPRRPKARGFRVITGGLS